MNRDIEIAACRDHTALGKVMPRTLSHTEDATWEPFTVSLHRTSLR
ncbi:Uncharacterised protein [Vibrio cholerae]|nr:Uncharacterised protein [Vibrio cholerae]CSI52791.1 Uncharacterised protein [Vibrio cholerae]